MTPQMTARSTPMKLDTAFFDCSFELFEATSRAGSIGADAELRQRIEEAFLRLGQARETSFGDAAYLTATASFKRDFAIDTLQPWTAVWDWPASRAVEILNYLDGRYAEAVGGH